MEAHQRSQICFIKKTQVSLQGYRVTCSVVYIVLKQKEMSVIVCFVVIAGFIPLIWLLSQFYETQFAMFVLITATEQINIITIIIVLTLTYLPIGLHIQCLYRRKPHSFTAQ